MSLGAAWEDMAENRAPRVSGDEPVTEERVRELLTCSPRERG